MFLPANAKVIVGAITLRPIKTSQKPAPLADVAADFFQKPAAGDNIAYYCMLSIMEIISPIMSSQ